MTAEAMNGLLAIFCVLSVFLLIGCFIRSKVKIIGKMFIPASVIGGVLLLLLGPELWGARAPLAFSDEWMDIFSTIPSILVIPIFASVPLGFFSGREKKRSPEPDGETITTQKKRKKKGLFSMIGGGTFLLLAVGYGRAMSSRAQYIVGLATNLLYSAIRPDANLYWIFGWELERGFAGGHSTAAAVGASMQKYGWDFWEISQGVTVTTATIGLVGGMIIGIIMVNLAVKKGWLSGGRGVTGMTDSILSGIIKDRKEQEYTARETIHSHNMEMLTLHLAVILVASGMGMILSDVIDSFSGASLPAHILAMISMYLIDFIIARLHLGYLFDRKLKSRLSGMFTDFAIVAAVGSMPLQSVAYYVVPVIIMCAIGFVVTFLLVFNVFRFAIPNRDPFEHAILVWGMETGTLINGMMLLKLIDPEYETTALQDYSNSFVLTQVFTLIYTIFFSKMMLSSGNTLLYFVYNIVKFIIALVIYLVATNLYHRHLKKRAAETAEVA